MGATKNKGDFVFFSCYNTRSYYTCLVHHKLEQVDKLVRSKWTIKVYEEQSG